MAEPFASYIVIVLIGTLCLLSLALSSKGM